MRRIDSGSASAMLSSVSWLNTTPKPNVSSGALRSSTSISLAGSARLSRMERNSPAGPPPTTATLIAAPSHADVEQMLVLEAEVVDRLGHGGERVPHVGRHAGAERGAGRQPAQRAVRVEQRSLLGRQLAPDEIGT